MNQNFLITGASSGLGKEFALKIATIAKNIVIVARSKNKLNQLKKKIKKLNPFVNIIIIITDLSNEAGINALFKKFKKQNKIKFIEVLVNSAANFTPNKIEKISMKQLKKDFCLNVFAPFMISRHFGIKMKKRKKGIIFNIGSSSSYDCSKETSVYCSTKHALLGMSKAFNAEWKMGGVKSIFIAPGSMKTPMGKKVKFQNFNTFIDPVEVADLMKNFLNKQKSIFIDEVKIKRIDYK